MDKENEKSIDKIKKGDVVIFRNIFAILSGRVCELKKNVRDEIYGYQIQCVDSTFTVSTYSVGIRDVIRIVKPKTTKKINEKSIVLFIFRSNDGQESFLTGRIKKIEIKVIDGIRLYEYDVMTVNNKFKIETHHIFQRDVIEVIERY